MHVMTATRTDWVAVSKSILRAADLPSLDDLLEEALDAWLEKADPEVRWEVAIELYLTEQVNSGRAAKIAGLNYCIFEFLLKDADIAFIEAETSTEKETQQQEALIHAALTSVVSNGLVLDTKFSPE